MNLMRLLIIILIVLVGAAVITQLNSTPDNTRSPIMTGLETIRSWFNSVPDKIGTLSSGDDGIKIYKWTDEMGEVHFSNHAPPEGVASSIKIYRSDTNITPATSTGSKPTTESKTSSSIPASSAFLPITNPTRIKQLFDDAKNVGNLSAERKNNIDQRIEN